MKSINIRRFTGVLFCIWILIIIILSVIPGIPDHDIKVKGFEIRMDYIEHFVVFAVLAVLLKFSRSNSIKNKKHWLNIGLNIIFGLSFSYLVEFVQIYIPGRTYNTVDFVYNMGGFILIYLLLFIFQKKKVRQNLER